MTRMSAVRAESPQPARTSGSARMAGPRRGWFCNGVPGGKKVVAMAAAPGYPVRVDASLEGRLSRGRGVVKGVRVSRHYVVRAFRGPAFAVPGAGARGALVSPGRSPGAIFEFKGGVLGWPGGVQYYAIGAFGTDRYPP